MFSITILCESPMPSEKRPFEAAWLVPGLACAAMYLALSVPLSELARRLERRLARDQRAHAL